MNNQNFWQITSYEFKKNSRDRGFRAISLFSTLIVISLHILTQSDLHEPEYIAISLSSAIPLTNAYIVNYLQIIFIIIWGGNFVQEKQYFGSSIYIRPFSNTEFVWGKIFGFILVMLIWIAFQGFIAGSIHLFFTQSPFAVFPYLFYFATLTIPILIFTTSITLFVKIIVRNKMIAMCILFCLLYFAMSYSNNYLFGGLDLYASTLPNMFSEITGFPDLVLFLLQRTTFWLWGIGMILLSSCFIARFPNDNRSISHLGTGAILFLCLGCIPLGIYYMTHIERQKRHDEARDVFAKYENLKKISVSDHKIRFEQNGKFYKASSQLVIENTNSQLLDSVILYLNPGLKITSLSKNNQLLDYQRCLQAIVIPIKLEPGEKHVIDMQYEGTIFPDICYAEMKDLNSLVDHRKYYFFNMGKDFYYLTSDFTLLTPECLWYPTAIAPVNIISPYATTEDYTRFQLSVINNHNHIVISQGKETQHMGTTRFVNTKKISGLSLCIGNYIRNSITIDNVLYELFLLKGHEKLLKGLDPLKVHGLWTLAYRFNNELDYAFDKLNIVEVPVHFCAYPRYWKDRSEYVQAELLFRPEREALTPISFSAKKDLRDQDPESHFYGNYQRYLFSNSRNIPTGNLFINKFTKRIPEKNIKNENDISFLLHKWHYHVTSSELKGINFIFQELQNQWEAAAKDYMDWQGLTCTYFENHSLEDVFSKSNDELNINDAIYWKARQLLRSLLCFIPYNEFYNFHQHYIEQHTFQTFRYETYCAEFEKQFNIDLMSMTRHLFKHQGLASFQVRDAYIQQVLTPHGEKGFVQSVKVRNTGTAGGVITLSRSGAFNIHYFIPTGSCKEIRNYIQEDLTNYDFEIKTNLSKNRPSYYAFTDMQPRNNTSKPYPGIFDSDTSLFHPQSGEFIVDNEDPGFYILQDTFILKKILSGKKAKKDHTGEKWKRICMPGAYGEPIQSYHTKPSGRGHANVVWETCLPESGVYELFIYNTDLSMLGQGQIYVDGKPIKPKDPIQVYRFCHSNGEEEIKVETKLHASGWVSLGEYTFHAGLTRIILSDQGADEHQYIYADAVKWVKKYEKNKTNIREEYSKI